jgi:hypothetical protein
MDQQTEPQIDRSVALAAEPDGPTDIIMLDLLKTLEPYLQSAQDDDGLIYVMGALSGIIATLLVAHSGRTRGQRKHALTHFTKMLARHMTVASEEMRGR